MSIAFMYGPALQNAFTKKIDFAADTVKCLLLKSTYIPNQDTHATKVDLGVGTNEVTGTGYTAGGTTAASKTLNYDGPTNTLTVDCADPLWTTATITGIRFAVFLTDSGTASTSYLLTYIDFIADQAVSAANFSVVLPSSGVFIVTAS